MKRRVIMLFAAVALAISFVPNSIAAPADGGIVVTEEQIAASCKDIGEDGIIWIAPALAADWDSISVTLPAAALAPEAIGGAGVGVITPMVTLIWDASAWAQVHGSAETVIVLRIRALPAPQQDRPCRSIELATDGGRVLAADLYGAELRFPYTLRAGETAQSVFAAGVDASGAMVPIGTSVWRDGVLTTMGQREGSYAILHRAIVFDDTVGHWGGSEIGFAAARGLMDGMTATAFEPDRSVSWAMTATVLARLNRTNLQAEHGAQWYAPFTEWAVAQALMPAEQDPLAPISRADLAHVLTVYLGNCGTQLPAALAMHYADRNDIAPEYWYSVACMTALGIMQGRQNGTFDPEAPLTRAELAIVLSRLVLRAPQ